MRAAAHNVLHAMASGLAHDGTAFFTSHLAAAAARAGTEQVQLELVAGIVSPGMAATPALARYATAWSERWPAIMAGVGVDPGIVAKVWITAQCDLTTRAPAGEFLEGEAARIVRLSCTVEDSAGERFVSEPPRDQLFMAP